MRIVVCRVSAALSLLVLGSLNVQAQTLTFGAEELLAASSSWTTNQRPRVVFTADGAKHIAWIATNTFGSEEVYTVGATSAAATYGPVTQLSGGTQGLRYGFGDGLELKVNGPYVLATWEGDDFENRAMWFARSSDNGASWEAAVRADDGTVEERAYTTGTLFPDGRVAKVWIHYDAKTGEPDHQFRAQDEFGVFGPPSNPATMSPAVPCECCTSDPIVLDDGTVLVAYRNNESNLRRMYVSRSTDGGSTFPTSVRIDSGPTLYFGCPGSPPAITAAGQDVLVVWGKVGGGTPLFRTMSARSLDGGVTFASQVPIDDSDGTTDIAFPSVARRGNLAVAVWKGRDPVSGQVEIWSGTSEDGGSSWGPSQMITGDGLDWNVAHPGVAISQGQDVEIVWMDFRDLTEKVYRIGGALSTTAVNDVARLSGTAFAAPNPFRASTTLRAPMAANGAWSFTIVDVTGRAVVELAGSGAIRWDGRDAAGTAVPAGIYFARIEGGTASEAVRIVRLR